MPVSKTFCEMMTTARNACCIGVGALMLTSCSTPPKPPSVDEATRRPVNARAAVDLKACQGDLSRATMLVSEMTRAGVVASSLSKSLPQSGPVNGCSSESAPGDATGNMVAVVPFGLGSTTWSVDQVDGAALVRRARDATVIMIRGRTDATGESMQETVLARRRAEAAAEFLQRAGVSKEKMRLTWQGAGDPVLGLQPAERGQSRRVEIEFYTAAPIVLSLRNGMATGRAATAASL